MLFKIKQVDEEIYTEHLADFLPSKLIDVHTHIWLRSFVEKEPGESRGAKWPQLVAQDNSVEDLLRTFELLFPQQKVTPLVFGSPRRDISLEQTNKYVAQAAEQYNLPGLAVSTPEWTAKELEKQVTSQGFIGLKPYLSFAPLDLSSDEITTYDFLPHHQLEVANAHGWIVMLHIPRGKRLGDPVNLKHMLEIDTLYPNAQVIIAHIGRAYCIQDVGNAFQVLQETEHLLFDFSANTNANVMEGLIRAVGPQRILFGSDMPILRMRMRRICENDVYINLVPPGLYGDVNDDPHMREVSQEEGKKLSFFMYEELLAFRRAAEATNLTETDIEDIFFNNAASLIIKAGGHF